MPSPRATPGESRGEISNPQPASRPLISGAKSASGGHHGAMRILVTMLAAAALWAATASATTPRPYVAIDGYSPVVVVGSGFGHRARVHVMVTAGTVRAGMNVRSTIAGTFIARLPARVRVDACESVGVVAVSGSVRVVAKRVVAKTCGAPRYTP